MSDTYWDKTFETVNQAVHRMMRHPNPIDDLVVRIEMLTRYRDEAAAGVWHDAQDYPPPAGEWLLTWWGPDNGLWVARLSARTNAIGERYWIDWDGDPLCIPLEMPVMWARTNVLTEAPIHDTARIDACEAMRRLMDLADRLRRNGKGHLFIKYSPHVAWLNVTLFVPKWSDGAEEAAEGTIEVGDDGMIDAARLKEIIADVRKRAGMGVEDE